MKQNQLLLTFNMLPPSVNNYLKPSAIIKGGKAFVHMYETKEAKEFKSLFGRYLKARIKDQNWDKSITENGHWYLDLVFYLPRTNIDNHNLHKILLDAMNDIVFIDDKNILPRVQKVLYDSKSPRFVALLQPVDYVGVFNSDDALDDFERDNCNMCKKALISVVFTKRQSKDVCKTK